MPTRIKISNDTSATLSSSNPTLAAGELCFEIDTGFAKLGDGTTPWNSLPYIGSGGNFTIARRCRPAGGVDPPAQLDRRPEGDIGTKNFIFAVARTGDLSAPASVSWSLGSASDLESGQATSGTVGWLAGDGSGRRLTSRSKATPRPRRTRSAGFELPRRLAARSARPPHRLPSPTTTPTTTPTTARDRPAMTRIWLSAA